MQQLEAQEGHFAESLVSLQFQKAARRARTLWAYTALLTVQDLLLQELSASETLTKSACAQILESHSPVSGGPGEEESGGCTASLSFRGRPPPFLPPPRARRWSACAAGAGEGRVGALYSPGLCRGSWEADLLNVLWETGMPLAAASGRIASFTEL